MHAVTQCQDGASPMNSLGNMSDSEFLLPQLLPPSQFIGTPGLHITDLVTDH